MKYFELAPFELTLNAETITSAVRAEESGPEPDNAPGNAIAEAKEGAK
jgi:hypothetical protein